MTRRTVQEEIICDRCGKKEIVEGDTEHDLSSKTTLSKLFPVWIYRKPEDWIAVGDTSRPYAGGSDYCPQCAKELERLLGEFYSPRK